MIYDSLLFVASYQNPQHPANTQTRNRDAADFTTIKYFPMNLFLRVLTQLPFQYVLDRCRRPDELTVSTEDLSR